MVGVRYVIFKDCGDVFLALIMSVDDSLMDLDWSLLSHLWEIPLAVADQQARLPASAISYHHKLFGVCWRLSDVCAGCVGARGDACRRSRAAACALRSLNRPPAR